eukprot:scaffold3132_cov60-Phaeocystis_antarctica.AAC.2
MLVSPPLAQYLVGCEHIGVLPRRGDSHCRAAAVLLPCCCRAAAVLLPCCCRAAAVLLPWCCRAAAVLLRRYGRGAAVRVQCCVLRHLAHARRRQTARRSVMPQRELTTRPAYAGRGLTRQTYRTLALTLTLIRHGLTRRT